MGFSNITTSEVVQDLLTVPGEPNETGCLSIPLSISNRAYGPKGLQSSKF